MKLKMPPTNSSTTAVEPTMAPMTTAEPGEAPLPLPLLLPLSTVPDVSVEKPGAPLLPPPPLCRVPDVGVEKPLPPLPLLLPLSRVPDGAVEKLGVRRVLLVCTDKLTMLAVGRPPAASETASVPAQR